MFEMNQKKLLTLQHEIYYNKSVLRKYIINHHEKKL